MAVDVVTEVEIAPPREEVAAFSADPTNATAWYKNIKAVEWETSPPVAVGSKLRFRAQFLGRTLEYTYEVRELDPALRNRGEPSGFAAITAPLMTLACAGLTKPTCAD